MHERLMALETIQAAAAADARLLAASDDAWSVPMHASWYLRVVAHGLADGLRETHSDLAATLEAIATMELPWAALDAT